MNHRLRIALYSHDTVGLGHMRRNLLVARALARSHLSPAILMIAGSNRANAFSPPPGLDFVTLPALYKHRDGRYGSGTLPLPVQRLVNLRARTIRAALEAFDPDLVIVDKVPRGALGELMPALASMKGKRTQWVLGLRDILDEPDVVRREWDAEQNESAIAEHYAAVWVYGDPNIFDLVREYGFGRQVASRMIYTGYLDARLRLQTPASLDGPQALAASDPQILCTVGGGQDGGVVARAFVAARLPEGSHGLVVTGPFMPPRILQQLKNAAAGNARLELLDFVGEGATYLHRAQRVVTMGGYNTIAEVLSFRKPALVVPRVSPRREQLIRAERLQRRGLVDCLHPDDLTPDAISEWLAREPRVPQPFAIDLDGTSRLPLLAEQVLHVRAKRLVS